MPRLFVSLLAGDPDRATLDADQSRHLRALRLARGDEFEAICGPGNVRRATVERYEPRSAIVRLGESIEIGAVDPARPLILAAALADLGRFDLLIEKACELGATEILPVRAERTQIGRLSPSRQTRWQRIARAACEQCGRTSAPRIEKIRGLEETARRLPPSAHVVVLDPTASVRWDGQAPASAPLALFTGPEGGFSHREIQMLREQVGAQPHCLGPRILRFETAAIAGLAIAAIAGTGARRRDLGGREA